MNREKETVFGGRHNKQSVVLMLGLRGSQVKKLVLMKLQRKKLYNNLASK